MLEKEKAVASKTKQRNVEVPNRFLCKITEEIMSDPVIAPDGFTYERDAITEAIKRNPISPMTREPIDSKTLMLIPNRDLKSDIKEFLQKHPELYATDVYLSQASKAELITAIQQDHQKAVENLLNDSRLLLQPLNDHKLTALHIACETQHIDIILFIIRKLQDKGQLDNIWRSGVSKEWKPMGLFKALTELVTAKNNQLIHTVMEAGIKQIFDINTVNAKNQTLVHIALTLENSDMVEYLIGLGFKSWRILEEDGKSCLHCAIKSKSLAHIRICLENDVSVNIIDDDQRSALFDAIENHWEEGVTYLLENGAKVTLKDKQGRQVIHEAARHTDSVLMLKMLLEKNSAINEGDKKGVCPIHLAAESGNLAFLDIVQNEENILTSADGEGNQPVHYAAKFGQIKFLKQLISLKVNLYPLNKQHQTPYELASQAKHTDITSLIDNQTQAQSRFLDAIKKNDISFIKFALHEYPHLLNQTDEEGKHAYLVACETSTADIIRLLQENLKKKLLIVFSQIPPKYRTQHVLIKTLEAAIIRLDQSAIKWCLSFITNLYPLDSVEIDQPKQLQGHTAQINGLTLTPEDNIVTWSKDGTAKIWDRKDGKCLLTLQGHTAQINGLTLTPEGNIITWSQDGTAKIWDRKDGKCLATLQGHTGPIHGLTFTPEGNIVTWSQDNTAKVWDRKDGKCLVTLQGHTAQIKVLTLTPEGNIVTWSQDGTAKIWDRKDGKCLFALQGHTGAITGLTLTPEDNIVTWSQDNTAKVWDRKDGKCLVTLQGDRNSITGLTLTPEGNIVIWSQNGTAKIWDRKDGKCLFTLLQGHINYITGLTFTPDGNIVIWSQDGTAKIWDRKDGKCLFTLQGHKQYITGLTFTPEGNIVTWSQYGTAKIWDIKDGKCLVTLQGDRNSITGLTFTPEGNIVTWSQDGTANIWNIKHLLANEFIFKTLAKIKFPSQSKELITEYLSLFKVHDYFDGNATGETLLHLAAQEGNIALIEFLLDKKISIELASKNSLKSVVTLKDIGNIEFCPKTPLHYAIMRNQPECVRYLLSKGADVEREDGARKRPLQIAAAYGAKKCAEILLEYFANVDAGSPNPKTIALSADHQATAAVLDVNYQTLIALNKQFLRLEAQQERLSAQQERLSTQLEQSTMLMYLMMQKVFPDINTPSPSTRQVSSQQTTTQISQLSQSFFQPVSVEQVTSQTNEEKTDKKPAYTLAELKK